MKCIVISHHIIATMYGANGGEEARSDCSADQYFGGARMRQEFKAIPPTHRFSLEFRVKN